MKKKLLHCFSIGLVTLAGFTSCQGMLNMDSEQVLFTDENKLDAPTDTVYSVIGIINKMQKLADRTVLLGEVRADLVSLTPDASLQLQALANFTSGTDNVYNAPQDYYAVINNCNYFIANADTSLRKRNNPIFLKEYAAVKSFRAWTYLQLAQVYGSVPFITEPILSEMQVEQSYEKKDIQAIAEYFIEDLSPYVNTPFPAYGSIGGVNSQKFFIPVRLLLGDLNLWAGHYNTAAMFYHDYLTNQTNPRPIETNQIMWPTNINSFEGYPYNSYSGVFEPTGAEVLSYIPMEANKFNGLVSDLRNVFNSTTLNQYFFQATFSGALKELSASQPNCKVYTNTLSLKRDTTYAPTENTLNNLYVGDLRLASVFSHQTVSNTSLNTFSTSYQTISKIKPQISTYRVALVYLRYAEALNRAGFPTAAFAVLKHGMTETNIGKYVDSTEIKSAGSLVSWDKFKFTANNTIGIHSRGCGDASADKYYIIPALASRNDTIEFVEEKISNEMALETPFEGYRFYDLLRISMRRNDNGAYLARKIAGRNGTSKYNQDLYDKLTIRENWYLPLK